MGPRLTVEPHAGPYEGGTHARISADERWFVENVTEDCDLGDAITSLVVVYCTRLRRMPVRAHLEVLQDKKQVIVSVKTPNWGRQECVSIELQVNKVTTGTTDFIFYAQPRITYARPHYVRASEVSTVTLKGTDLPSSAGVTLRTGPNSSKTLELHSTTVVRMRCGRTHDVLHANLKPVTGQGSLTVEIGRVAMTGTAYFEVSINGIDYEKAFRCWNDELQLLTKDGVVPAHATQLQAKMENASVCFWETPLPLDVEPQRLVFPPRGASEAQSMPGARLLCGGFPIIDTGSGQVIVNITELIPAHVCAAQQAARGALAEDGNAPAAAGGSGARTRAVCNHDVPAEVEAGGRACRLMLPSLKTQGEVDLEMRVSCDGGRTFSAPCPTSLEIRFKPLLRHVQPMLMSCEGGTRMTLNGDFLAPLSARETVWVKLSTKPVPGHALNPKAAASAAGRGGGGGREKVLEWKVQAVAKEGGSVLECFSPKMRELATATAEARTLAVEVSTDSGRSWEPMAKNGVKVHPPVTLMAVSPSQMASSGGASLHITGQGLYHV